MDIIVATNNQKKLKEMRAILEDLGFSVKSLSEANIEAEIEENGTTFAENAFIKAHAIMTLSGKPTIADDSGLCVTALSGEPGVYSARYGGKECQTDVDRYKLLLKNMEGQHNREAYFASAICLVYPDGRKIETEGRCYGKITEAPFGEGGFGYDPVFYLDEYKMTMAELPSDVKNKISHRANALTELHKLLENGSCDK